MSQRLDIELVSRGLVKSRERAKKIICDCKVKVNNKIMTKPSFAVCENDEISAISDDNDFVGRGGLKLETAFSTFQLDINGMVCADIGASTGGFTDCMLRHGASKVFAVDVGHGQLDPTLINNPKVINCEGINVRYIEDNYFGDKIDFISVDVSFISLRLIMVRLISQLADNGKMVVLIKPQFEVGKANIGKGGIVKDKKIHKRLLNEMCAFFSSLDLRVIDIISSAITGGDGNIEYLAYLDKNMDNLVIHNTDATVDNTFNKFR